MSSSRYPQHGFDFGKSWSGVLWKFWIYEALTAVAAGGATASLFFFILVLLFDEALAQFVMPLLMILSTGVAFWNLESQKRQY